MAIGSSIFLIALGAVLRYAVTAEFAGIDVGTVGLILMIAGGFGLLLTLFMMASRARNDDIIGYRTQPPPPPRRQSPPPPPPRNSQYPDN